MEHRSTATRTVGLAGALMFFASSASGFVTGQTIAVDGGAVHL